MMSLFFSFDFYIFYFSLFVLMILSILLLSKCYFFSLNFFIILNNLLSSLFYSLNPLFFNKFSLLIFVSSFFSIISMNMFSIFPYSFPFTTQFGPLFFFSMSFWLSLLIFSLFKNLKGFFLHMIPEGAPLFLILILFLIELFSNMIRPLTLTVRLVANILAGHLLLILLSKMVLFTISFFPFYLILNLIEIFVAFIQAYIFCVMMTLYFSEIN